jgi:uncharacterized membrane protein YfcA
MNALAVLGALAVGLTLGLLGSGGSILTVPVLVYVLGQPEKVAIAGSLAIVGAIALIAAVTYARQRLVDWRSVLLFGLPGMAGTWLGAWAAQFVSGALQLFVFALVMLAAAWSMSRPGDAQPSADGQGPRRAGLVVADGLAVGALTGFVGVGGGFLIVPALVLLGGLTIQRAIATSLVVIAMKSAAGFWKYLSVLAATGLALDWTVIGVFVAVGGIGSMVGNLIANRLPQAALKRGFSAFLLLMAAYIIWRTLPALL